MNERTPLRVFLSSTSTDLRAHRVMAADGIQRLGYLPVQMETFGAIPHPPVTACLEKAVSVDAFVVLVAHRYGWVPSTEQGGDGSRTSLG